MVRTPVGNERASATVLERARLGRWDDFVSAGQTVTAGYKSLQNLKSELDFARDETFLPSGGYDRADQFRRSEGKGKKGGGKNFPPVSRRNPLKSNDSD